MSRRVTCIEPDYFDALYAADTDPWQFATSPYEAEKYAATIGALPRRHFADALEVGCSIGVLTRELARFCDRLLAIDVADAALAQARAANPGVHFERRRVPQEWPVGRFDLIVLSEVLYYLDAPAIEDCASLAAGSLRPGGSALLVHYLGETDYPQTGDEAASRFIAACGLKPALAQRMPGYRIDRLDSAPPE